MAAPTRVLPDLISSWEEYMAGLPVPSLYIEHAGVFTVSAALTRRVWHKTISTMPPAIPNLYTCLVGAPGVGKDLGINPVAAALREVNKNCEAGYGFYLGEESLSPKGLIDSLASTDSEFAIQRLNGSGKMEIEKFHSLIGCIPELGTFIPEYDVRFISILNELYNCKPRFADRIRGQWVDIERPHVGLLLGTQPNTLARILPEHTFHMGFTSRTMFVFARKTTKIPMYEEDNAARELLARQQSKLWKAIISDLRSLLYLTGEMHASPAAKARLNHFHMKEADKTQLIGSRFEHYNTRRTLHLVKLCMVMSASRGTSLEIDVQDVDRALDLLYRTEAVMPEMFADLTSARGFHSTVEEIKLSEQPHITHAQLITRLRRNHPPYEVGQIIKSMLESGDIRKIGEEHNLPIYSIMRELH